MGRTVLVAGASGFVGTAATERFVAEGARVIGIARHRPDWRVEGADYILVDLRDAGSCTALAERVREVTHLVYAAVNETPGDLIAAWTDPHHAERNGMMFDNLLGVLEKNAPALRHVTLVHGTKAYATHRPDRHIPVPLREYMPRPDNDDFYFRQEDRLWAGAAAWDYGWTVLRAPILCGGGRGSNLNNLLAIAVFASLRRDAGLDLPFPGTWPSLGVTEMVDVELFARAIDWASTAESARDQIFNVANGDAFTWADLWPVIAEEIDLPLGIPIPLSVRAYVDGEVERWTEMVRRHGLSVDGRLAFLGESASLVDFAVNNTSRPILTSTIRIRQAGFHDCVDTAESVIGWLRRWRAERLIPPR